MVIDKMFEYYLDYLFVGVVIGALLITILFLILYWFGLFAMKSDFSNKWVTKANIIIVNKGKKK